jgi:hypothetical protein
MEMFSCLAPPDFQGLREVPTRAKRSRGKPRGWMSKKFEKLPPGPQLGYFVVFSASHWKQMEQEYGKQLPDRVRKLISLATALLTLRLPIEQNAPKIGGSNSDILADIERFVEQAEQLRAKLYPPHYWAEEHQSVSKRITPLHRRLGTQLHEIDDSLSDPESAVMHISLTGFIESPPKVVRRARNSGHNIRQGDAWDQWIALLTMIMRAFDLPYGIRSDVYRVKKGERAPSQGSLLDGKNGEHFSGPYQCFKPRRGHPHNLKVVGSNPTGAFSGFCAKSRLIHCSKKAPSRTTFAVLSPA